MIALLLNSGRGTRMGGETREHPKCMCRLDETDTIISWQVRLLQENGITEAVVTTGPFADMLREHLEGLHSGIRFHYVPNPDYASTNYIYSMYLARDILQDDVISLHGDLVLEPDVMRMVCQSPVSCGAVDGTLPLPEKDFKAQLLDGRIRAIGVDRFGEDCVASQPAYKFLKKDFQRWMQEIERFVRRGETGCYAENAFNAAWEEIPLMALDVKGMLCSEIDTPEDHRVVGARFKQMKEQQS